MATKKTAAKKETKAAETKTEVKTEAKAVETKAAEVKTAETKAAPKAAAKTTKTTKAAKVKEAKVNVEVQYLGFNNNVNDIVEAVKAAYKAEGNTDAIESIDVYVQPENRVAYYVVNGNNEGKSVNL